MLNGLLLARLELKFEPSCDGWVQGNTGGLLSWIVLTKQESRYFLAVLLVDAFIFNEFPRRNGEGPW